MIGRSPNGIPMPHLSGHNANVARPSVLLSRVSCSLWLDPRDKPHSLTVVFRKTVLIISLVCAQNLISGGANLAAAQPSPTTQPASMPMLGDYCLTGLRTADGRTDIPRLMEVLKEMGVTDYMHLVWREKSYPKAWEDFKAMAPLFQQAGIRLWLYLTPPSEKPPEPFGNDYVRWAKECALIAKKHPVVQGIAMDDFNGNVKTFTPEYCQKMMTEARAIAPDMLLYVICYYGYADPFIKPHVQARAIDGVICPYYAPHRNHSNTQDLYPQAVKFRGWLDEQTAGTARMPIIWMVYGTKVAKAPDACTPGYVRDCLAQALKATREGYADGAMTYCLPKDKKDFVDAARTSFSEFRKARKNY